MTSEIGTRRATRQATGDSRNPFGLSGSTTLDPATLTGGTHPTLSNGNLTVSGAVGGNYQYAFSTTSHATGKFYHEFTVNANNSGAYDVGSGITNTNGAVGGGVGIGADTKSGGHWGNTGDGGFYQNNNAATASGVTYGTVNDVVGVAVDIGNNRIWYRVNGGNWNGNPANNPATNTGGISITPTNTTGLLWVAVSLSGPAGVLTYNFGATSYANAAPSGFGNW